jgi:hypothetical protein
MVMLLESFLQIVNQWNPFFPQFRTAKRAIRQALGSLICIGRRTITRIICAIGNENQHWSGEYFLHSRSSWSAQDLFEPIAKQSLRYCRGQLLGVVVDDTSVKKTGKRIFQAFWSRDPMSPPFHPNLRLGIRFLQFALVIPLHRTLHASARTIPIRFEEVSAVKKPRKGRKDYDEKMKQYKELRKTHNLTIRAVQAVSKIRNMLDLSGAAKKLMIIIGDGAFCNRKMFSFQTQRTELLVRVRKDIKLCRRSASKNRFYDQSVFTPKQALENEQVPWRTVRLFYGGKRRLVRFKEVPYLYWQTGAKKRPLRLFIIEGNRYRVRKTGRSKKRETGFLLTTLLQGQSKNLLQLYFDRWQIEVNHREEKTTLGVGQAQVHNYIAVPKQPALVVAAYSALLVASLNAFGPSRTEAYSPLPRWRANAKRPSCLDLITLLRKELAQNPQIQHEMGIQLTFQTLTTGAAA